MSGIFITFEGLDGCGKTTQSILLAKHLTDLYGEDNVILAREPGGTSFNEILRDMLLSSVDYKVDKLTELFLFLAMRRESFVKIIDRAVSKNKIVISDRCIDSTVAYQGYGCGVDLGLIEQLNTIVTGGRTPDITFVIDVEIEKALSRATCHGCESSSIDFYSRVREGFRHIVKENSHRCRLVSCLGGESDDIYAVHNKIVLLLESYMEDKKDNILVR